MPVRLDTLVEQIAGDLAPLAGPRGVRLVVSAEPVTVQGDPDWLTDAVTNVAVNAIQYNVDGGEVRLTLARRNGKAELAIADAVEWFGRQGYLGRPRRVRGNGA